MFKLSNIVSYNVILFYKRNEHPVWPMIWTFTAVHILKLMWSQHCFVWGCIVNITTIVNCTPDFLYTICKQFSITILP